MQHPGFYERAGPFSIAALAQSVGAEAPPGPAGDVLIEDVRPVDEAGAAHMTFIDNPKFIKHLAGTQAGACFIQPAMAARVPVHTIAVLTKTPYRAFALALQKFYPEARWPKAAGNPAGGEHIDPSAVLEDGVVVEPGAVVGPEAHIGRGSRIAAGAVVGYRVHIGRGSYIGACASVQHALIGDRVIIQAGARIGGDGFGFSMGRDGHIKVPQVGRVIIQDDVEIGTNTCIDRGALKDTIIGEGTKIDNLVQIGHNVVIGRHAVIVGQVGISGSAELGDFVVMGGHAGVVGHVKIGAGAQIAGSSHVNDTVPPGARMGGTPAVPFREWARQIAAIRQLGKKPGPEAKKADSAPQAGPDDHDD